MTHSKISPRPAIWSETLTIHSYDVDLTRHAAIEALCRYFLEAAWNHAEALGFGFGHLAAEGKVWVLSRLLLDLQTYPRWGDTVSLHTWPRGIQSIFALRDFELQSAGGQAVVAGSSAWLILDARSRRPQRVERFLSAITPVGRQATQRDPEKLPAFPSAGTQQPGTSNPAPSPPFIVRYSDVDLNGHVNSARYLVWLMDSYPREWHERRVPCRLEINYLGESHQGELLSMHTQATGPQEFLHSIRKIDGQEACRAQIQWRDRN